MLGSPHEIALEHHDRWTLLGGSLTHPPFQIPPTFQQASQTIPDSQQELKVLT